MRLRTGVSFPQISLWQRAVTASIGKNLTENSRKPKNLTASSEARSVFQQLWSSSQVRPLLAVVAMAPILALVGCAGVVSAGGSSEKPSQGAIQVNPTSLTFASTTVGKKVSQNATVVNTGTVSLDITQASVSSAQFTISGLTMPMSLPAGQSSVFQVWFDPTAPGNASATLTVQTDSGVSSEQVPITGAATAAPQQISLSTTSLSLGNAAVGSTAKGTLIINNAGGTSLVISLISLTGAPFGVSGVTTPATIAPAGSATLNVSFTPTAIGIDSGSLTITSNDPQTPSSVVTLTGTGTAATAAPTITTQPVNETVTAGQTATFTVVAAGTAPLSYQWQKNGANIAGATGTSYTTPATATTDSGSTFDVVVTNTAGTITSNAATLTVNAAAVAPTITTQPANETVTAGQTATFTVVAGEQRR